MTSCTEQTSVAMAPIILDIDLRTRDALQAKIEKTEVQWTLHPELRVPHCKDLANCRTCTRYIDHVEAVREGKDGVSGTALKRRPRPIPAPIILEPPRSKPRVMLPTPRTLGTHTSEIDSRCARGVRVLVGLVIVLSLGTTSPPTLEPHVVARESPPLLRLQLSTISLPTTNQSTTTTIVHDMQHAPGARQSLWLSKTACSE
ncbi:hypothetical protein B0H10DRAFT_1958502 [Mycena sp. CBHHK59/15]|nr:hypothetical protein B0H10DRAFT_1958502 [Mycena sp. CBHHK59/15]